MLSRRHLLALSSAGLLLPRQLLAARGSGRRFLFVFAPGGWDPAMVFAPVESDIIERGDTPFDFAEASGVPYVSAPTRPSVDRFFEAWGDRAAVINGLVVRSLAHEVCLRLVMTGSPQPGSDCWTSLLAAHAEADLPMPAVHIAGPTYAASYPGVTVRVGQNGQLPALLSAEALSELRDQELAARIEALEDAYTRTRLDRLEALGVGQGPGVAAAERVARRRADALIRLSGALDLGTVETLAEQGAAVADCFELGLSRCGMVSCLGYRDQGWDNHANHLFQDLHFETLFDGLNAVLADLASRPGETEATLLDETVVVVLSEMGRNPTLNASQGKEHWPWTAAMILGSGVQGGQAVGGWDETLTGRPVDLASGAVSEDGVTLDPTHLGATLLALADIDPDEHLAGASPIAAVLA